MGHLVITIGCEYGAKGNAIGRKIAEDLGIKFYDRELVDQIIEEVGIRRHHEPCRRGRYDCRKRSRGRCPWILLKYADLTERAIHVQKQIIRKLAEKEACVIIGRSADYILKDSKDIKLLRAFIYAPDEIRISEYHEEPQPFRERCKNSAAREDKRYHKRHLALTGSNRGDRHNRDILINSAFLGVEGTAEYLEELIQKKYGSGRNKPWNRKNQNLTKC